MTSPQASTYTSRRSEPAPPHPQAGTNEVQAFFRDYFLFVDDRLNAHDAQVRAEKLSVSGQGVYRVDAAAFGDAFGSLGGQIYDVLASSPYSHVS